MACILTSTWPPPPSKSLFSPARNQRGYVSVEDLIVYKLMAWRPQDRDDIAEVLAVGHELDTGYIEYWAGEWEVLDRWQQAVDGAQVTVEGVEPG